MLVAYFLPELVEVPVALPLSEGFLIKMGAVSCLYKQCCHLQDAYGEQYGEDQRMGQLCCRYIEH